MDEKRYYVYEWIRLDTNEPFYVGKGCGDRWRNLYRDYNPRFMNIINKVPVVVSILIDNLTEEESFDFECYYIWLYRDIIGYDICNIPDGGEGQSLCGELNPFYGKHHSEETRKLLSEQHKGMTYSQETKDKLSAMRKGEGNSMWGRRGELSPHWGKKHSEERKDNISKALGTSVRCIELDMEFNSLNKAEIYMVKTYNIRFSHKTLKATIEGERKVNWYKEIEINGVLTRLHWEYC